MQVFILIKDNGKEYSWNELTEKQKEEMKEKLNKQTADRLGYS